MDQPTPVTQPVSKTNVLKPILIGLGVFVVLASFVVAGYFYWQNRQLQQQLVLSTTPQPSIVTPTIKPSPVPEESTSSPVKTQALKPDSNWLTYATTSLTIKHPSNLIPKYTSNRGVGANYHAGDHLLNQSGDVVLDFFYYPYNGGSRRQAFYDAISFDGPENPAQFTQSATDVSLNGRNYLKLNTTYTQEAGGRLFYLTPVGNRLYYFTYPAKLEKDKALNQTLLTIIASSEFNSQSEPTSDKSYIPCLVYTNNTNKGQAWDATIDSNQNMVVIQRFSQALKPITFNPSKIQVSTNLQQDYSQPSPPSNWTIVNINTMHDPTQKSNLQDAIIITLSKEEVVKIRAATQSTIPSVSFSVKISQSFETQAGTWCAPWSSQQTYYTNYPN